MKQAIIAAVILVNVFLVVLIMLYVLGFIPAQNNTQDNNDDEASIVQKDIIFYAFNPPIVVNVEDGNKLRFMQIELQLLARTQEAIDPVAELEPLLRHELILLFSGIDGATIKSVEAKDKLRQDSLALINKWLKSEGRKAEIENVLFTKLIIQ